MREIRLPLPGLSPVNGKASSARFNGGALPSNAGLLTLRAVERRLDVAGRLATGIDDPRDPTRTVHSVANILRFHMLLIAAGGYEDGIDANALRGDPVLELALERLPGERDLSSQSTISRSENLPDRWMLLRLARAMVGLYCASFSQVPKRITLDIAGLEGDTFDAVHGCQQLRLFNAHYDDYGFQPIVVFDGAGRFVTAVLRPAKRPNGREIAAHRRRLIRAIRSHWPRVEIVLRGDSHYCAPEVLDLCRAQDVDFVLGLPPRSPWRHAQFDTLRLRLIKIAARVVELKTRITIHLPTACSAAPLMRLLLERLPRMAPRAAPRKPKQPPDPPPQLWPCGPKPHDPRQLSDERPGHGAWRPATGLVCAAPRPTFSPPLTQTGP